MTDSKVLALFDRLDAWRHFPAYQLERRADIFFSLYLGEVVEHERGVRLADVIIPELPIKHPNSALSFKVDYLLTTVDRSRVFLVELKTDLRSRRTEQDDYLLQSSAAGMESLLLGIRDVAAASKSYQKYYHLLHSLEELGFLQLPHDLAAYVFPKPRRGLTERLRAITLTTVCPAVEVLYVQPLPSDSVSTIDFACFARHVARHDDPLSQRFAESLLRWRSQAGLHEVERDVDEGSHAFVDIP